MSAQERSSVEAREPASWTVAGYMAAAALFAGVGALVYYPGRLGTAAMFVALLAVAMGGPHRRLATFAVVATTLCWLVGMVIAVLAERPIF